MKEKAMNNDYIYKIESDEVKICRFNQSSSRNIEIPASIDGYKVTEISYFAFKKCKKIESIVIPDTVKIINHFAFSECTSLKSIVIPDSVEKISDKAFFMCKSLTCIRLPNSATFFNSFSTDNEQVPPRFLRCKALTSIIADPENKYYSTKDGILYSKDGSELTLYPEGLTNAHFSVPKGVKIIGEHSFSYCDSLKSIHIPDSVTQINIFAFTECKALAKVELPDSPIKIDSFAFESCKALTQIDIPAFAKMNFDYSFCGCTSLAKINVHPNHKYLSSLNGVVYNKNKTALLRCPEGYPYENLTIPDSVIVICEDAFRNCKKLKHIDIADSVKFIDWFAFYGCSSLESVYIPNSVIKIGVGAFDECDSLTIYCRPNSNARICAKVCGIKYATRLWKPKFK